jgi:hypothetical protein
MKQKSGYMSVVYGTLVDQDSSCFHVVEASDSNAVVLIRSIGCCNVMHENDRYCILFWCHFCAYLSWFFI